MLYYIYNTTTRLTFILLLLLVVIGMYNPSRKWAWNSHIYGLYIPIAMRRREINVSLVVVLYM
jgi:hypothetical protein